MRGVVLGLAAVAFCLSAGASKAKAQGNFSDPFYLYYSWYLPRQQVLANQPGPEIGIMANQVARQQAILSDRASLYAPIRGVGEDELNSATPYSGRTGRSGVPRFSPSGQSAMNLTGRGVTGNFNRVNNHYPTLRTGGPTARAKSRAPVASGVGGGGGGGSIPPGMNPMSGMGGFN